MRNLLAFIIAMSFLSASSAVFAGPPRKIMGIGVTSIIQGEVLSMDSCGKLVLEEQSSGKKQEFLTEPAWLEDIENGDTVKVKYRRNSKRLLGVAKVNQ